MKLVKFLRWNFRKNTKMIKTIIRRYFWLLLITVLAACQQKKIEVLPTNISGITLTSPVASTNTLPTFTPSAPLPTLPDLILQPAFPSTTPLPAFLPQFPLTDYVALFTKDDDLYFQDGANIAIKLAEEIFNPYLFNRLSDDNQKVVFFRDDGNAYSINTDGTGEQIIIPGTWLDSLEMGTKISNINFVPKTHLLYFETILCKQKSSASLCSTIIFIVDTDIGAIREVLDLELARQESSLARNIVISPDGKMIVTGTMNGTDVFTLDGVIIHKNILPYSPSESGELFPSLFWLPDSSGFIAALPNKKYPDPYYVDGTAPAYTLWRHMLNDNSNVEISFDPLVKGYFQVSPDGKWIVYGGASLADAKLYLGEFTSGSTKLIGLDLMRDFDWSPDSQHFIHGNTVIVSFNNFSVYGGIAPEWIDSNHYLYLVSPSNNSTAHLERILIGEIRGSEIFYYESGFSNLDFLIIKSK